MFKSRTPLKIKLNFEGMKDIIIFQNWFFFLKNLSQIRLNAWKLHEDPTRILAALHLKKIKNSKNLFFFHQQVHTRVVMRTFCTLTYGNLIFFKERRRKSSSLPCIASFSSLSGANLMKILDFVSKFGHRDIHAITDTSHKLYHLKFSVMKREVRDEVSKSASIEFQSLRTKIFLRILNLNSTMKMKFTGM